MSSSIIDARGAARQLDASAAIEEQVTEEAVKDAPRLARYLGKLIRDVADLRRRWVPRRIDFEDLAVAVSTTYRLQHGLRGRVRWWVVDWTPTSTSSNQYAEFFRDATSDDNALVLLTGTATAGVVTIRVEAAG